MSAISGKNPARIRVTLRLRLTAVMVLLAGSALALGIAALWIVTGRAMDRYAEQELAGMAELVQYFGVMPLELGEGYEQEAAAQLRPLVAIAHVRRAALYRSAEGPSAEPFASWSRSSSDATAWPTQSELRVGITASADILRQVSPVRPLQSPSAGSGAPVGLLLVEADRSPQLALEATIFQAGAFALLALSIATALLAARFASHFTRPIRVLLAAMAEVGQEGEYRKRVPVQGDDELARLSGGFNAMIESIASRDAKLHRHREELEEEVSRRTQELVLARDKAEAGVQAKSRFLGVLSHELRTPMNAILGFADLGIRTKPHEAEAETLLAIQSSALQLQTLLDDILDFSEMESGAIQLKSERFDLLQCMHEAVRPFVRTAISRGLTIRLPIHGLSARYVRGDGRRLRQVLHQLASNAVKFSERGSIVVLVEELSTPHGAARRRLRFAVTDEGCGIAPARLTEIFVAFSQLDMSRTRRHGGLGIGLSIAADLVHAMGGKLEVQSTEGRGTTFSFEIELECEDARPFSPGGRVAVLHPDPSLAADLLQWLDAVGCIGQRCENVDDLVQLLASAQFDTVLIEAECLAALDALGHSRTAFAAQGLAPRFLLLGWEGVEPPPGSASLKARHRFSWPPREGAERQLVRPAQLPRTETDERSPHRETRHLRVLLVEDNPVNQRVAKLALERSGHEVSVAEHGAQALDLIAARSFDIVLMDMQMPVMDGLEATTAIRRAEQERGSGHLPILALTANAFESDRASCMAAGMDGFLTKPLRLAALDAALQAFASALPRS